jgi:hypothetical protein
MKKMINKEIGVSCLIALTLVVVVVVSSFSATNVYADSYKHKDKDKEEGKRLRVIIDLVKEDVRDHVLYDRYEGKYYYKDVYDPNLVVVSKDAVKVGQPFYVYIENLENEHNVCYDGYNHKGKRPEYVTAFLPM